MPAESAFTVFSLSQKVMSWAFITVKKIIVFPLQIAFDGTSVLQYSSLKVQPCTNFQIFLTEFELIPWELLIPCYLCSPLFYICLSYTYTHNSALPSDIRNSLNNCLRLLQQFSYVSILGRRVSVRTKKRRLG